MIPGAKRPDGRKWTFADHLANILRIGEFLHDSHGAEQLTPRAGLEYVIKQYRAHEEHDIAEFWALRPDLKPADWAEKKDDYMRGDPRRWEGLAWV